MNNIMEKEMINRLTNDLTLEETNQFLQVVMTAIREIMSANKKKNSVPIWEKYNLSVEEAAAYSNIGQNKLYSMIQDPRCSFVLYVGTKRLIKRKAFERFLQENIEI